MEQILNEIKRKRFQANTNTDKADIIFKYHSTKKQLNEAKSEVTKNRNRIPLDYSALSAEIALNAEDN